MERKIDRFLKYLEYKGITENKATVECDLSKGLIGQAKNGKCDLGAKAIEKILIFYQDLNKVWLITGEGPMLTSDQPENPAEIEPDMTFIKNRLMKHIESQDATISSLLDLLKAEREKVERLEEELRTYREHKGETAPAAAASSAARAV